MFVRLFSTRPCERERQNFRSPLASISLTPTPRSALHSPLCSLSTEFFHTRSALHSRSPDFCPALLPLQCFKHQTLKIGLIYIQRIDLFVSIKTIMGQFHNFANMLSQQSHH